MGRVTVKSVQAQCLACFAEEEEEAEEAGPASRPAEVQAEKGTFEAARRILQSSEEATSETETEGVVAESGEPVTGSETRATWTEAIGTPARATRVRIALSWDRGKYRTVCTDSVAFDRDGRIW